MEDAIATGVRPPNCLYNHQHPHGKSRSSCIYFCGTETLIDRPSLSGAECAEGVARPWLQVALSVHERLRVAALGVLRKG